MSHLSCLSRDFLAREASSSSDSDIIPRGGHCSSCNGYVLWGDVIRGCYRRREGGATPEAEQDDANEQDEGEDLREQLFGDQREDEDEAALPRPGRSVTSSRTIKQSKARGAAPSVSKPARLSTLASCSSSDEREHFDLDNISGESSDEQDSDDGRPQWHSVLPPKSARSRQGSVPPRATPVYPRPRLRDSEDHRGAPTSSHAPASHGRPQTHPAVGAEGPRFGFTSAVSSGFSPPGSAHSVAGKCVTEEYPEARRARRQGNHARPTWQERTLSILFCPRQGTLRAAASLTVTGDPLVHRREPRPETDAGRWRSRGLRWANQVCGHFPTCHHFHRHGQR